MTSDELQELAHELRDRDEAYALVTVVRAIAPTSAYVGAQAIVLADGTLHGWIVQLVRQFLEFVARHCNDLISCGSTRSMAARSAPGANKSRYGSAACMPRATGVKPG